MLADKVYFDFLKTYNRTIRLLDGDICNILARKEISQKWSVFDEVLHFSDMGFLRKESLVLVIGYKR